MSGHVRLDHCALIAEVDEALTERVESRQHGPTPLGQPERESHVPIDVAWP